MRALVISDTHFGAWTGEDLLRHEHELAMLAPHLDDVDEVIFLGDLFDFLFSSVTDAVAAADACSGCCARSCKASGSCSWRETMTIT